MTWLFHMGVLQVHPNEKSMIEQLNLGLKNIRANGVYKRLFKFYLERFD